MVPGPVVVLASRSPRRRELLGALGVDFETVVPEVEELGHGEPAEVVVENARRKARAGLGQVGEGGLRQAAEAALVLGVDTDVELDGRLLGKAGTEFEARSRLEALSGRTHEVLSGVVLLGAADVDERTGISRSHVTFRDLSPELIDLYVASGEWRDRAGAYAIQGLGSVLVGSVRGDFSNVVGLPLGLLLDLAPELRKSL